MYPERKRSNWWFLLPIFIGLIGGIIAYFVLRHDDPKKAKNCLYLGIILAIIGIILNLTLASELSQLEQNFGININVWFFEFNVLGSKFNEVKSEEDSFKVAIKHVGSFGNTVEIFQPKNQTNVMVVGSRIPLKNNQNARYLRLNEAERTKFEQKVADFCYSIKAVHRMSEENGKKVVGVFVVLDKEEQFNQQTFHEAIQNVTEMSDKTTQFLIKAF